MFGESKGRIEILVISNRYKNILGDFIDSLDIEFPIMPRSMSKRSYNIIANSKDLPIEAK